MSQYHVVEPSALRTDYEFTIHTQQEIMPPRTRAQFKQMKVAWNAGQQDRMVTGKRFHNASGHILEMGEDGVQVMFRIDVTSVPVDSTKYTKNASQSDDGPPSGPDPE